MASFETVSFTKFIESGSRCKYPPGLYLVATPIGNLEDITLRALFTLSNADVIYCEDTRVTKKLLTHYGISTSALHIYNDTSSATTREEIVTAIQVGKKVALVSDAGMPLIADPGYKLVQAVLEHDLYLTCIPGPSASLMGLVLSGFPTDHFCFRGFLPRKAGDLQRVLQNLPPNETTIFYESARRLGKALQGLSEITHVIQIAVARELTKRFEAIKRGTAQDLLHYYTMHPPQGEVVLIVQTGALTSPLDLDEAIKAQLTLGRGPKEIAHILSHSLNRRKNEIYQRVLKLKKNS